ncbi:helix-turn-helix domain-containing protein [Mucilaginibacter rubeus]|uniref:Helix-turn-helix domain-containing protein n=1 Tax=Mucilaginibacter rubeus TaxID=2027860 RepID=A0AAE6MGW9_9SPHI|nr:MULTISPECIES: AraC family transcriptional regulator [Mucilaginibacter]QEM02883.1 helix-turn-helix domain-containing protein [Mucilaginibacter rubeus]QEM15502.1 helix-turn-helix domain-containing protein [Mucilaginibacter gossypii]QTE41767.1 helix-turn-helix domain-containing protein [Mucilaginibacter rubeus]QTE48371.1 helix-turn-helix domain-containing protein [Mucilaginibacter rubeus]QTE59758.1 helix-turn-helix domain-containing protein [Mucilaginibacter rubeus]
MKLSATEQSTGGDLLLLINEKHFDRMFFTHDRQHKYLTIAWNRGEKQIVTIDEVDYDFLPNTILPLMVNQSFRFERPEDIVAWQFNRDFYCIVDHDEEVSCVGFLFYGSSDQVFVTLDEAMQFKLQRLLDIFIEEFETADNIQIDMLRMLLKRLIIIVTRLAKAHSGPREVLADEKFGTIRKFNLLVENNYREHHTVAYYAQQLNKSPKTLSNLFALYNHKAPLQVIQERLIIEAKRLLYYTDKSAKEITYELGFDDAAYFSNFFKKHTSFSPTDFRNNKVLVAEGK